MNLEKYITLEDACYMNAMAERQYGHLNDNEGISMQATPTFERRGPHIWLYETANTQRKPHDHNSSDALGY